MLSYFLHIMRQKSGGSSFVCVQLLQTLNILFENIRNETSLCMYTRFSDKVTVSVSTYNDSYVLKLDSGYIVLRLLISCNSLNLVLTRILYVFLRLPVE